MPKIFDRILASVGLQRRSLSRGYDAARWGKLLSDWATPDTSPDDEIRNDLQLLRARSRDLERNNDYARRFFVEVETNVLGAQGMMLRMNVRNPDATNDNPLGTVDKFANRVIEEAYWDWTLAKNCTTAGDTHWKDADRLALRTCARDGFPIIRLVRNFPHNRFRFAVQLLEPDCLDHTHTGTAPNGNAIKNGVELDGWGRRVAFHMWMRPQNDPTGRNPRRERIDASEIILPFQRERIGQTIGAPWLCSTITRLRQLGEWERAAVAHARAGACQMGFFESTAPTEEYEGEKDDDGTTNFEAAPLQFTDLPAGKTFKSFNPAYPNGEYDMFRKGTLKGIAAGMCSVAYHTLAQDLEGANYSSMRAGVLTEREIWMLIQGWWIRDVEEKIFEAWLEMALLTNQIPNLPFSKFDKFNSPNFCGRRWKWVDPLKDITAAIMAINNGLSSWSQEIATGGGGDSAEVFSQLSRDLAAQRAEGIILNNPKEAAALLTDAQATDAAAARAIAKIATGPQVIGTLRPDELAALRTIKPEDLAAKITAVLENLSP